MLIGILGETYCALGWLGREIYRQVLPIAEQDLLQKLRWMRKFVAVLFY